MQRNISKILDKIQNVRVAVYGDFCLDAYWIMDPAGSEISVETGQQAKSVARHYYSPGGAANVAANIAALSPQSIKAIGVIGDDIFGRELNRQLSALNINTDSLIVQKEDFATYAFVKQHLEEKEISRTDFGVNNRRSPETEAAILAGLRSALENYDVLVFNQQIPDSIANPSFISAVNQLFETFPDRTILVDSRHFNDQFKNVYLKINEIEIAKMNGVEVSYQDYIPTTDIEAYGLQIYQRYEKPVFITCGSRGILAVDEQGIHKTGGLQLLTQLDTTGAGDTALSALALCLGAGCSPAESIEVANLAAAATVQKVFTTGTAKREEILAISEDPTFVYQPELAKSLHRATYVKNTEIEWSDGHLEDMIGNIQHAVFDHDGTISTLREGWEAIMEPVMIKAILGPSFQKANPGLYERVQQRAVEFIDQSTGIQTIVQMETLVDMVDEFNVVPKDQILDKFGYKEVYNDALLEMVNRRMSKFKAGELQVEDFTIKGAVPFLHQLKEKGIKLYLASGTDQEDVIKEAETLGYAHLFDGGIYGSVGDVKKYSKKMVFNKIVRENQLQGNELIVFGDGPVEIQEGRKVGGIAVGIACDEPRRYGLNPEKRSRLIRAGAHCIVPDFSQRDHLLSLLFKTTQ